jgi:isopenicillin-N epimerase
MIRDDSFWISKRRELFPATASVNLNAGTLSPTPIPVQDAAARIRARQAAEPSDFLWRQTETLMESARQSLAAYLNAPASELLLLPNVTHAINLAIASLHLEPGSEILTTDHEYGAMLYCCERYARERGWTLRQAVLPYTSEDPNAYVQAIEKAIGPKTRVLFFSHVASTTGLVLPAAELCALARARGLTSVVDGAHAVGMVPLDLARMGADFYGGNCHKWLMAPLGAGFLSVRAELKGTLIPLAISWGWKHTPEEREARSGEFGTKWHFASEFQGCTDHVPQMVIPAVLALRASLGGEDALFARVRELAQFARERISALGFTPATPKKRSGAITAFEFPNVDQREWRDWIWTQHRIECPVTKAAGRTFLRVSTPWYALREEIEMLMEILRSPERFPPVPKP